jgi:TP53 regulating kinase and related kinases
VKEKNKTMELIAQGAEAKLFRDKEKVIKERISKEYRLEHIDIALRKFRTRREAKVLGKLDEMNFPAPRLHSFCDRRMSITMDFVEGEKVRDVLDKNVEDAHLLAKDMGTKIATLHNNDMVHGDLTTSNMIKTPQGLTLIDFGLSSFSDKVEDKAVDLSLLDRALMSKHYKLYPLIFEKVLEGYSATNPLAQDVLDRLQQVQKRGRHKK